MQPPLPALRLRGGRQLRRECFLEACIKGGQVYLRQIPADEIFPDGPISAAGQYDRYVRLSVENVGLKDKPIWLLLEQVYTPGKIERKLWQLDDGGKKMGQPLALDQWPGFKDARNAGVNCPPRWKSRSPASTSSPGFPT